MSDAHIVSTLTSNFSSDSLSKSSLMSRKQSSGKYTSSIYSEISPRVVCSMRPFTILANC